MDNFKAKHGKATVKRVPRREFTWLHVHNTKQTLRSTAP